MDKAFTSLKILVSWVIYMFALLWDKSPAMTKEPLHDYINNLHVCFTPKEEY